MDHLKLKRARNGDGKGRGHVACVIGIRRSARLLFVALHLSLASIGLLAQPQSSMPSEVAGMIAELGCVSCHSHSSISTSLRDQTPDLSQAGLRYLPSYLFEFLQNPERVRRHLGRARMPDFHLSPREALALTLFLGAQTRETFSSTTHSRAVAAMLTESQESPDPERMSLPQLLTEGTPACVRCHAWQGQGGTVAAELGEVGRRLRGDWMKRFLVDPTAYGVGEGIMPSMLLQEHTGDAPGDGDAGAARRVEAVVAALTELGREERDLQDERWREAREAYPEVTVAQGREMFEALQCQACHRFDNAPLAETVRAPAWDRLGEGIHPGWMTNYLRRPIPVRPFGFRPGSGSRMPDFRLEDEEVSVLASYFLRSHEEAAAGSDGGSPSRLSVFARNKAQHLLKEKLSCLGCHVWQGQGGRIGPDLSRVGSRLTEERIHQIIADPRAAVPHAIIPQVPMPEADRALIVSLLANQKESPQPEAPAYLSPLEHAVLPQLPEGSGVSGQADYMRHCAACHGAEGQGNGYNAAFLPVQPTAHANEAAMKLRPDDTLFDGIYAGGYILNKSPAMPPWGQTLEAERIRGLVVFIRQLCACQGPEWSLDDALRERYGVPKRVP